jgi:hypothetical protein
VFAIYQNYQVLSTEGIGFNLTDFQQTVVFNEEEMWIQHNTVSFDYKHREELIQCIALHPH